MQVLIAEALNQEQRSIASFREKGCDGSSWVGWGERQSAHGTEKWGPAPVNLATATHYTQEIGLWLYVAVSFRKTRSYASAVQHRVAWLNALLHAFPKWA